MRDLISFILCASFHLVFSVHWTYFFMICTHFLSPIGDFVKKKKKHWMLGKKRGLDGEAVVCNPYLLCITVSKQLKKWWLDSSAKPTAVLKVTVLVWVFFVWLVFFVFLFFGLVNQSMDPGNKLRTDMQPNLHNLLTKVKSSAGLLFTPFRQEWDTSVSSALSNPCGGILINLRHGLGTSCHSNTGRSRSSRLAQGGKTQATADWRRCEITDIARAYCFRSSELKVRAA